MITYDDLAQNRSEIVFSEDGDTLIIENDFLLGINSITGFIEETLGEDSSVFFDKSFQYTVDGIMWSDWLSLTLNNIININTKYNHVFGIKFRYIRKGTNSVKKIRFVRLFIHGQYSNISESISYNNSYLNKYIPFLNIESINWTVNVLNKVFKAGIVPKFIERSDNVNWIDEDYINFWWGIIYINALKYTYSSVFSNILDNTNLVKKLLIQKDIITGEKDDLATYYYLLTHYYDEIMKRGSSSVFDDNRTLPNNYDNIKLKGELLRLCNQPLTIESSFGIISGSETGWIVGETCPNYRYNDSYVDFIKGFEVSEDIKDVSLYSLLNNTLVSLDNVSDDPEIVKNYFKVNTLSNSVFAGVDANKDKAVLVDEESDYEISFRVKGLLSSNKLKFAVKGYNFLGNEISFVNLSNGANNNIFIETDGLTGDLFVKGVIRYKSCESVDSIPHLIGLKNLKFPGGIEKISPIILIACNNDVYIYDIKIKLLPPTYTQSTIFYNSELIIKVLENYISLTKDEMANILMEKLIPVHTVLTFNEKDNLN